MTPAQAAKIINCSANQVRWLIRNKRLQARRTKVYSRYGIFQYWQYDISLKDARKAAKVKQGPGYPRGVARK